mmetsp:Transcript_84377/g.131774  ORF Transcript_84377/g.131774 Transcript_84377/m.131774 type:complete len:111 (-) Transcript_84377:87-419(-)
MAQDSGHLRSKICMSMGCGAGTHKDEELAALRGGKVVHIDFEEFHFNSSFRKFYADTQFASKDHIPIFDASSVEEIRAKEMACTPTSHLFVKDDLWAFLERKDDVQLYGC